MSDWGLRQDQQIIERYLGQPSRLPDGVRAVGERALGEPLRLYAMVDLDAAMSLTQRWVMLSDHRVALAEPTHEVRVFERAEIRALGEEPGLSATRILVLGAEGDAPLAELHYTHRQRRAVENIRFVLEQQIEGRHVDTGDPDLEYARAVASPVREAQALVAGNRRAVLWRLLAYLAPYRRRLGWGFAAAAVITLVSLVPPWLAGYLIDRVVGPVQDGTVPVAKGATVAWMAVAAMGLVYVVRQGAALARLRLMAVVGELVARDLRGEVYAHLQKLSMGFFSRKKTGSLITRVTSDTDRLWEFLAFGVVDVSLSLVMLAGLSVVLLSLDWKLGLVMVLPVPAFCWAIFWHGERMERLFLRTWRKWSRMTDVLGDTLPGIKVVKAFSQEEHETGRFSVRNARRNRGGQPPARVVDDVLADADAGDPRDHRAGLGVCGSAAAWVRWRWPDAFGGDVRLVPAVHDHVHLPHRGDRADDPDHEPGHQLRAPGLRGAGHRAGRR